MNNYEKIKNMSVEQMVELLIDINQVDCNNCCTFDYSECNKCFGDQCGVLKSTKNAKQWLQQEAE